MGIEAAVVAALVTSLYSANEQRQAAVESSKQQREAGRIRTAQQRSADIAAMRQKAREERVRRARIQQAAENTGVGGSSGEIGAVSALRTQLASAQGFQSGQAFAADLMSNRLGKAAEAEQRGAKWAAIGQLANTVFSATGGSLMGGGTPAGGGTSTPATTTGTTPSTRLTIFD